MMGEGKFAKTIRQLFEVNCEKYGLNKEEVELSTAHFRREPDNQMEMFG